MWVKREPEVIPSYPDRLLPVDEAAAKQLKKRPLTNLYNARPAWLSHAHDALDAAVASAYGWGGGHRGSRGVEAVAGVESGAGEMTHKFSRSQKSR